MNHRYPIPEVDLHGQRPENALRRLAQALHTTRVQGGKKLLVITGKGFGNRLQQPILRSKVESWLQGPEGRRAGVSGFQRVAEGGALEVKLL
ncbi:MAG: DNA-nicking Smr family endonuclease [Planctomycetota bacterium]|jgi:DNA-nicking Smr family endonuclease